MIEVKFSVPIDNESVIDRIVYTINNQTDTNSINNFETLLPEVKDTALKIVKEYNRDLYNPRIEKFLELLFTSGKYDLYQGFIALRGLTSHRIAIAHNLYPIFGDICSQLHEVALIIYNKRN